MNNKSIDKHPNSYPLPISLIDMDEGYILSLLF